MCSSVKWLKNSSLGGRQVSDIRSALSIYSYALGCPLIRKVGDHHLPPSQLVPFMVKTNCAKDFYIWLMFRGVPRALKFDPNHHNVIHYKSSLNFMVSIYKLEM